MWFALANAVNAASNTPARDESDLEFFFGMMALAAFVTMLLWLYFRVSKAKPPIEPPTEPPPEPPADTPPQS